MPPASRGRGAGSSQASAKTGCLAVLGLLVVGTLLLSWPAQTRRGEKPSRGPGLPALPPPRPVPGRLSSVPVNARFLSFAFRETVLPEICQGFGWSRIALSTVSRLGTGNSLALLPRRRVSSSSLVPCVVLRAGRVMDRRSLCEPRPTDERRDFSPWA